MLVLVRVDPTVHRVAQALEETICVGIAGVVDVDVGVAIF